MKNRKKYANEKNIGTLKARCRFVGNEDGTVNGPYAPFGCESIEKQLWRNKQNDRPISDSEIKAVLSQLFKTDQWLPPGGHVSEDVTSHA
ncbi:hypothetical protein AVEN_230578-1 [Araneus ventricosus]|uniref:Uncharacterized protein n=1 Tax=Araneus ventricosus TaxID=182803 RepID=A0A4Y2LMZ1_ARAVE|nr:hypothetical protein AVEN_230578-1 [Araneus ventricosus]